MEQHRPSPANKSALLDFSKDSLNSSAGLEQRQEAQQEEEEEDEESCSSIKLEPLAFTIDFGDVAPVNKKKKETPKRLAERLSTAQQKRQAKAEATSSLKVCTTAAVTIQGLGKAQ